MKAYVYFLLAVLISLSGCQNLFKKKPVEEEIISEKVKSPEELLAEEQARQDSIKNMEFERMQKTAFGNIRFGMSEDSVIVLNEKRQQLGKYNYNFSYMYNNEGQLYKLKLASDAVRAIQFDSDLNQRYQNLFKIIQTKYGEPLLRKEYPSIFDVQNQKKYPVSKWEEGRKQINIGLQEKGKNSYSAYCEIVDKDMNEAEQQRLKNLKNKDIIDAASKF